MESIDYFQDRLSRSNYYVEYGSGGSTVLASRLQKRFLSIESDAFFMKAVRKKIKLEIGPTSGRLIHANVGITGEWGTPFVQRPTRPRLKRWLRYAEMPWLVSNERPQLVLIDGRFRVLCLLLTLVNTRDDDTEILFDDYIPRREAYHAIEQFAKVERTIGDMVSLRPLKYTKPEITRAIDFFNSKTI